MDSKLDKIKEWYRFYAEMIDINEIIDEAYTLGIEEANRRIKERRCIACGKKLKKDNTGYYCSCFEKNKRIMYL